MAGKELAPVRAREAKEVLGVGDGRRDCSERRRVERPAGEREQSQPEQPAPDLEATIGDVPVRDPIAGEMQRRAESERSEPRAG